MAKKSLVGLRPPIDAQAAGGPPINTAAVYASLADTGRLRTVPVDAVVPNPHQPRREFNADKLEALAQSIRERGLLQPIVVRALDTDQYELIAGERRWRAHQLARLRTIDVILNDHDSTGSALDAIAENVMREDLNPIEEAHAYATVINDMGLTRESLGTTLGVSRSEISNTIRLLDLPESVQDHLRSGKLTKRHGRALLTEPKEARRRRLADQAAENAWSVKTLEHAIASTASPAVGPRYQDGHRSLAVDYTQKIVTKIKHEAKLVPRGANGFRLTMDFNDPGDVESFLSDALKQRR